MGGLGARLFAAHIAVLLAGVTTMLLAARFTGPAFFEHHMAVMLADPRMADMAGMMARSGMEGMAGMHGASGGGEAMFGQAFRAALLQALGAGAAVALVAAGGVSAFVAARISGPVRRLAFSSRRIATGQYAERVPEDMPGELSELATSFNEMATTLESTERRRLDLIADVAHELRTPVATLQGYLEGLLDGVVQPSEEIWAKLHDETGRMRRLIDDLQELSRAEARQLPLSIGDVPVAEIVSAATDRVAGDFEEKGLTLTVDGVEVGTDVARGQSPELWSSALHHRPSPSLTVHADRDRAVQVLTNLLANALRYTPAPGAVRVTVHPVSGNIPGAERGVDKHDAVEFVVSDTGIGIAAEHVPHLFERFYRVDRSRSRSLGGSGIGLTIARALVEAMGGRIWADSPGVGQGATFAFTLPLHPPAPGPATTPPTHARTRS